MVKVDVSLDREGVLSACPGCGKLNRVKYSNLDKVSRCGNCKGEIAITAPIPIEKADEFFALIKSSPVPVLVDFWAAWCGPCRVIAPELEKVAEETSGKLVVAKVNTEEQQQLAGQFRIEGIPALILFNRGQEVSRTAGARPAAQIIQFVQQTTGTF